MALLHCKGKQTNKKYYLHTDAMQIHDKLTDLCRIVSENMFKLMPSFHRRTDFFCNMFVTNLWGRRRLRKGILHKYVFCRRKESLLETAYCLEKVTAKLPSKRHFFLLKKTHAQYASPSSRNKNGRKMVSELGLSKSSVSLTVKWR